MYCIKWMPIKINLLRQNTETLLENSTEVLLYLMQRLSVLLLHRSPRTDVNWESGSEQPNCAGYKKHQMGKTVFLLPSCQTWAIRSCSATTVSCCSQHLGKCENTERARAVAADRPIPLPAAHHTQVLWNVMHLSGQYVVAHVHVDLHLLPSEWIGSFEETNLI